MRKAAKKKHSEPFARASHEILTRDGCKDLVGVDLVVARDITSRATSLATSRHASDKTERN